MPTREVRDPVHGFIELEDEEWSLVDTPVFQRLRGIRQLALATLVYPGATHTRFEHSLGVRHVAGRMAQRLELTDPEQRLVRRAALLHDVGHGPFSHISEEALELINQAEHNNLNFDLPIHEIISHRIIRADEQINRNLAEDFVESMIDVLSEKASKSVLSDIVTGPVDADKQDYLLRDSLACGVEYGHYDIDRLRNTMRTIQDSYDTHIAFSEGGVQALEQFVLAKYYMNSQVYRHRIRRITDAMILRALYLGATKDKIKYIRDLFIYDEDDKYLELYSTSDDLKLTALSREKCHAASWFSKIFNMLSSRNLLKEVFAIRVDDLPANVRGVLAARVAQVLVSKIEQEVADILECQAETVVFHDYTIGSTFGERGSSEANLQIVAGSDGEVFADRSIIFGSIQSAVQERWLSVYGVPNYDDSTPGGRQAGSDARHRIRHVIESNLVKGAKKT